MPDEKVYDQREDLYAAGGFGRRASAPSIAKLGIEIDASKAIDAIETLKALADAAERASAALDQLTGKEHGGLTIKIVGGVGLVEIKPKD